MAKVLIEAGGDFNKPLNDGATPFYLACEKGKMAVIKFLTEVKF